jgi:hypothetical protein
LRKVERVIDQMQVPEETRVDCVTQLLMESAHSWWETIRERRVGEDLRWRNFREEFEELYYSWQHRKEKKQEFLDLKQGNMTVLEYERRFQDLSIFATTHLSTKHHRVERFRDGLRHELKLILVAMQFQSIQELVRVAQGIERVMNDTPRPTSEQSQTTGFKRGDFTLPIGRNPPPKKGKSGSSFGSLPKKGGSFVHGGSLGGVRRVNVGGSVGGQTRQGASVIRGSMEHRGPIYPICMRCNQKHSGDCSATPGRCYICRGEGHRWRDCQYLGKGCFHYGETGHRKKECPHRVTK